MAIQPSTAPRIRTRTPPPGGGTGQAIAGRAGAASGGAGWMKTGVAARQQTDQELARQREAAERRANGLYMPFRFRVGEGESREVVILDSELGPCFYEHNLQSPKDGKWNIFETCPKEWEPCPLCSGTAGGKESYYVMMLTCIDLTPWQKKDGTVVPYSKFLLPVKAQGQGFFIRQLDRHGTLRGLKLLMTRDTRQTASIGTPEFVEKHTEEDILASFGHPPVTAQDGKVIKQANADCFPFEYEKLFKKPSAEDLRRRYGGIAPAGSRQELEDEWGAGGGVDNIPMDQQLDDDIPY